MDLFIAEALDDLACGCESCESEERDRLAKLWDAAAAAEREACAKLAEAQACPWRWECDCSEDHAIEAAKAIRARGAK